MAKIGRYCISMSTRRRRNRKCENDTFLSIYTSDDFKSNDGMLTGIWGPSMWHYLHTMSFNYPVHPTDAQKHHYRDFVLSLEHVLPCGKCRSNLTRNFKKLPLTMHHMRSRETFSKYIYRLHELINRMLGKRSGLSYRDVRERYEHFRARCNGTRKGRAGKSSLGKPIENGCVHPLIGVKTKCVLKIVPDSMKCDAITVDTSTVYKE